MPAIYSLRVFAEVGGLVSYGGNLVDLYQQAGIYAGKILGGAKPADLPIHQPVKFELVINLKTAKALGVEVPFHLQQLADDVIELKIPFAAVHESPLRPSRPIFRKDLTSAFGGEAEVGLAAEPAASVENDPGCVKTLRGIIAPGILGSRSCGEQKNAKICLPLDITTKSDFVFTRPRP